MKGAFALTFAAIAGAASGCSGCRDKASAIADAGQIAANPSAIAVAVDAAIAAAPEPPFPADPGDGWGGTIRLTIMGAGADAGPHGETVISLLIQGNRVRYVAPNHYKGLDATTVVDIASRRLIMFPREPKEFMRVDLPPATDDAGAFPLTATGKTLTLQGLTCDVYEQKRGKASSSACIHDGIAFVDFSMVVVGIAAPAWMRSLSLTKRFVLRAVEIDDTGHETLHVEPRLVSTAEVRMPMNAPPGYVEAKGKMPGSPFRPGLPD